VSMVKNSPCIYKKENTDCYEPVSVAAMALGHCRVTLLECRLEFGNLAPGDDDGERC